MSDEGKAARPIRARRGSSGAMPRAAGRAPLRGICASPGVAVGNVVVFDRCDVPVPRRRIRETEIEPELARLAGAMVRAREELENARDALDPETGTEHRLVLEAHLLMHRDELLTGAARDHVRGGLNAEWAVRRAVEGIASRLRGSGERYLAERVRDVEHVGEEILRALTGAAPSRPILDDAAILIASDLSPAETAQLPRGRVLGLATELGTATSHTAILARALGIPCVVGVEGVTRAVGPGARVVLDALRGEIVVEPDEAEAKRAEDRSRRFVHFTGRLRDRGARQGATSDGTKIELHANVELEVEVEDAVTEGVEGIGLYRTEFLYLHGHAPSEDTQAELYERIAQRMGPRTVTLRTFDLGSDKIPLVSADGTLVGEPSRGQNPALGLRGLRLALARPELFGAQLRAVLRAARAGRLRLMFPMVATLDELRMAKAELERARGALDAQGAAWGPLSVGAMIELPSAVAMADHLAAECDFFSVGTNDLAQYALALDRTDPRVSRLAGTLEPSLLRMLQQVQAAAARAEIPVSVCGDLAAHPLAIPILLGLGYRTLSMPATEIAFARELVGRVDLPTCVDLAERALRVGTANEVEALVVRELRETLGDLWEEHGLDA